MEKEMKLAVLIDAENIAGKYIGVILNEANALGNVIYKRIYGNSDFPFNLQPAGSEVRYEQGETPQTEAILDDLLSVAVNENYTDEAGDGIIACFAKVFANLAELRESFEAQQ